MEEKDDDAELPTVFPQADQNGGPSGEGDHDDCEGDGCDTSELRESTGLTGDTDSAVDCIDHATQSQRTHTSSDEPMECDHADS